MDNLEELYAACILEYAGRQPDRTLAGPSSFFLKDARDAFNLPYDSEIFRSAMSILEDLGCLKKHSHSGMQSYYRLEVDKFAAAMKPGAMDYRSYRVRPTSTKDDPTYPFLESYADLGSFFLQDALETCEGQLAEIGADDGSFEWTNVEPPLPDVHASILSSSWTGISPNFELTAAKVDELRKLLVEVESNLDAAQIPNSQKAMARAFVVAAKTLADAPDPPVDLIWEMISRANQLAGVASLFVSIAAFFMAVAH